MRYRLTGPGGWALAFQRQSGGHAGDMPVRFGKYLPTPGEVPYDGSFRLKGLGQTTDDTGTTDSSSTATPAWLANLTTGITNFFVGRQQLQTIDEINQINIQRAAAGLPPINPNIAQPGVQVGLSSQTQTLLVYGALGIGALVVLNMFMKRRA